MNKTSKIWLAAGLATTLILSGCSGENSDDGPGPVSSTSVPDSADDSPAAFMAYVMTLVNSSDDETSEPLTVSDSFQVPHDEASGPQPLT